ncbi:MAG: DUF481 domain-containing protein [Gammaproteobacteria bacterium]|nr:DUF481 domain-containing protein [Gammaproteobacteria bacterium]
MNKNICILLSCYLCLSTSVVLAEVNDIEINADQTIGQQKETKKEAEESQSIVQQTLAAEIDAKQTGVSSPSQVKAVEKAKAWIPSAIDYDWLQLTSNEWLKGEIKAMYKDSLEFDSDKLDLLDIDWEDVKILRGHKNSSINIDGYGPTNGILEVTGQTVKIINDYETLTFDRSQLISFAPRGEKEIDLWSIKVTLGLDLKQGNTDQLDFTSRVSIKRRASRTRFFLDYIGTISKTDNNKGDLVETVNNHRVSANFDYYKTRHFFYTPVFAELFKDPFLNIDLRTQIGTGLGYTVIDDAKTELSFSGGPAFLNTKFISVVDGEADHESTAALVIRTNYNTALTNKLDFIVKYNILYGNEASGGYTHHTIATLESELTGKLDLDVSFIWDRVSKPTADANGVVPVSDDYRITVGISYTY